MGPDPADNVVDARLRIHGLEGIRVIDSSIMPNICGGNTTAPSIMIGEKGSDIIKEDWKWHHIDAVNLPPEPDLRDCSRGP